MITWVLKHKYYGPLRMCHPTGTTPALLRLAAAITALAPRVLGHWLPKTLRSILLKTQPNLSSGTSNRITMSEAVETDAYQS